MYCDPGDSDETIDALITAMKDIAATSTSESGTQAVTEVLLPEIPSLAMTPRDAFYATTEVVPFKKQRAASPQSLSWYTRQAYLFLYQERLSQKKISLMSLKTLKLVFLSKDLKIQRSK